MQTVFFQISIQTELLSLVPYLCSDSTSLWRQSPFIYAALL